MYGEFGSGAGVKAFYLQTTLTPHQLNWTTLISDIPGSERWPVRDLFQRNVDEHRVTSSLLPYLQDLRAIKFFNPLTLTLLPMRRGKVLSNMPEMLDFIRPEGGRQWRIVERKGTFEFRWTTDDPHYGSVKWRDTHAKLVAIDGQHRLSALKRLLKDTESAARAQFLEWQIPAVIVQFRRDTRVQDGPTSSLDVVRRIFVYINTEARKVQEEREILLSDEGVAAVCTQELVQRSHENDLDPNRNDACLPLLFFDWMGEHETGDKRTSLKSIVEVRDWLRHFLLVLDSDSDYTDTLRSLDIEDKTPLATAIRRGRLDYQTAQLVRDRANSSVLTGLSYLLENFGPYAEFTARIRGIENMVRSDISDVRRHALAKLRFGTHQAPEKAHRQVADEADRLLRRIEALKREIPTPLSLDIGMRGIVAAFASLRRAFGDPPWPEYAKWFTRWLNRAYRESWLTTPSEEDRSDWLLRHVVEDHDRRVVNYRFKHVGEAFGSYVELLIVAYGRDRPAAWKGEFEDIRQDRLDSLSKVLRRGYRREVRPGLRIQYPEGGKPLTRAVNAHAQQKVAFHIHRLEKAIESILTGEQRVA